MNDFEKDLRRVLRRREPPPDLSRRVMARIAPPGKPPRLLFWRPVWAAAAVLLILVTGFDRYRERRRGQEAKRQVMFALEITAQQLALAQEKAQEKIEKLNRRSLGHDQ